MPNFKIQIDGFDTIRKGIDTNEALQRILPDMSIAVLQFHNTLEKRVSQLFSAPKPLGTVLIGRSVKPNAIGRTFLRYSLQYQDKALPLSNYPVSESESTSISSAPIRIPNSDPKGFVRWKKGRYSKDYKVSIRKGKKELYGKLPSNKVKILNKKNKRNKYKSYAFKIPGSNFLFIRTRQTWHFRPTEGKLGTRTKLTPLYGPSLARLAAGVYDNDPIVNKALDKMQEDLIKAYLKY